MKNVLLTKECFYRIESRSLNGRTGVHSCPSSLQMWMMIGFLLLVDLQVDLALGVVNFEDFCGVDLLLGAVDPY